MYHYLGIFLLVFGALAKLYFNKTSFERRNKAGVEEYSSYWGMLAVKFLHSFSTFIIIGGVALIIIGDFVQ